MSLDGLRRTSGVEASQTGVVVGRYETGPGELQEITYAQLIEALFPGAPASVTGSRDDPEEALANLLTALEALGLIVDGTTET